MSRLKIPFNEFKLKPFSQFDENWFILTAGDFSTGNYNSMTISWGSIGYIWRRPIVHVVVRPSRHTYQFMESYDTFTLCAFSERHRDALNLIGTKSGRDGDKIRESGLTPIVSEHVAAPGYAEADLIIECRKIYWGDIEPQHFLKDDIDQNYSKKDYHRFYYGEILYLTGIANYSQE